jgi:hypothetical protein
MPASKRATVKRTLDLKSSLLLTDAQKARLAAIPDEQIDYSGTPHLSDAVWAKAAEIPNTKQP